MSEQPNIQLQTLTHVQSWEVNSAENSDEEEKSGVIDYNEMKDIELRKKVTQ